MAKADQGGAGESGVERTLNYLISQAVHLFLTGLAALILAAAAVATVVIVVTQFPALWRAADEYTALQSFVHNVLLVAIALELALLLLFHRTGAAVEVLVFVIARKMVSPDVTSLDLLAGAVAVAGLIVVRYYFVPGRPSTRVKGESGPTEAGGGSGEL